MRCKACDKQMSGYSIKYNNQLKDWEVCSECHTVVREIMETHEAIDNTKKYGVVYEMEAEPDE
tara:strand:+ start:657 stop:845 length:189 start_codon:yes stop_codon:yes gene_type:complete